MHCEAGPRSHPTKTRFRRRHSQTNRAGPRQHPSAHCRPPHAAGTAWLSMEACTQMHHQRPCACRPVLSAPGGLAGPQDYSRRCAAPFHSRASRHEAGGSEHKATPANQAACAATAAGFRCHRALQLTTIGIELRKANPTDRPCRARIGRRQVELATAPLHRRASRQARLHGFASPSVALSCLCSARTIDPRPVGISCSKGGGSLMLQLVQEAGGKQVPA